MTQHKTVFKKSFIKNTADMQYKIAEKDNILAIM